MQLFVGFLLVQACHALQLRASLSASSRVSSRTRIFANSATVTPLFTFSSEAALEPWERIDDVIMGGVSSSSLVRDSDGSAVFKGTLREEGGGFCGQRLKLLATPLDLSSASGLSLDCEAGPDADKRVWKMTCRVQQDRGEQVYQATFFPPSNKRGTITIPWSDFRLVRGPVLVPDAAPLDPPREVYQISLTISKFVQGATTTPLENFQAGAFRMKIYSVGTFGATPPAVEGGAAPRALTQKEQAAKIPLPFRLLNRIVSPLFGEQARRQRAAALLLAARGTSFLGRARLGLSWRARSLGLPRALARTLALASKDALIVALSIPARLLFKVVFGTIKLIKAGRRRLGLTS